VIPLKKQSKLKLWLVSSDEMVSSSIVMAKGEREARREFARGNGLYVNMCWPVQAVSNISLKHVRDYSWWHVQFADGGFDNSGSPLPYSKTHVRFDFLEELMASANDLGDLVEMIRYERKQRVKS
jgi:hypothetical protein